MAMDSSPRLRRLAIALVALILAGCTSLVIKNFDALFGPAQPKELVTTASSTRLEYERDIRPVTERRCLACHGCYDAPCQLKLDSYQGLLRGASQASVYEAARLSPAPMSRLFLDAQTTEEWRKLGFFGVLNERQDSPQANLQASLMAKVLDLKQRHPLPSGKVLPSSAFDFSLDRQDQCPRVEDFDAHATKYPLSGMPYGLPALNRNEHAKLQAWLADGAPIAASHPLSASISKEVQSWEAFFNGDSLKQRLATRYLYEHLYLAHLYLEDAGERTVYFKVVRSRTPPGQPLDVIATRRPYDDPGVDRVYYRLWRDPSSNIAKTHMPYPLSPARRERWRQWFLAPDYAVTKLPGYEPAQASNPFATFHPIPYTSRESFLLDEAQFTVMNFIKGPVCRGSVALNVIQDRFWVFFTTPQSAVVEPFSKFLAEQDQNLRLPAEAESGLWSIVHWQRYAQAQQAYLRAKTDFIRKNAPALKQARLNTFWDGDGVNPNAALTVFRHHDSASVEQGLVGEPPPTAWLVDYSVLERVHYLLVAGFDVYGTASHQAMTRMYMDFLRMEAEMNFLAFLPDDARRQEVARNYRGAADSVKDYLNAYFDHGQLPTPYTYRTSQPPKLELYEALRTRMRPVLNRQHELGRSSLPADGIAHLQRLNKVRGEAASILPEALLIEVDGHGLFSLVSDSAYSNISSMFGEDKRRLPDEDGLSIMNGVVGAYPNVFLQTKVADIPALVKSIEQIRTQDDYSRLLDRFGVRRTDARFWAVSDRVLDRYRQTEPIRSGVLDYSRYDNR